MFISTADQILTQLPSLHPAPLINYLTFDGVPTKGMSIWHFDSIRLDESHCSKQFRGERH